MISNDKNSILRVLQSGDASLRKDTIEYLMFNPIDEEILQTLCSMISDSNKGVRNTVSIALSTNTEWNSAKYLVDYISSEDIVIRNLAGEILMNLGSSSVDELINKLPGSNAADEKFIIDLLGQIGDQAANKPIIDVLCKSDDENVILACIEALGNLKAINSVEWLTQFYYKSETYRPMVMEALGKVGGDKSRLFMINAFDQSDTLTKYSIIEAMETIGDEDSCAYLLKKLSEFDGPLSWSLIKTISKLQEIYSLEINCNEKLKNVILDTIQEADDEYKVAAVKLALKLDSCMIVVPFMEVYGKSEEIDEGIKYTLMKNYPEVLKQLPAVFGKSPDNLKALIFLLKEILDVKTEAIKNTVDELQLRNLSDSLTKLLIHSDEEIRRTSCELLFMFDVETALMFTNELLEDENFWNRMRYAELLAKLNDPRAFDALNKLQQDENEMVSENAKNLIVEKNNNSIG